jgi:DNA-binding CsgD family transcriptional regulator
MSEASDNFSDLASRMIGHLNTPFFADAIFSEISEIAPTDLTAIIAFPMDGRPLLLHNGLKNVSGSEVIETYLSGTYLLDACYVACTKNIKDGIYRVKDVAPDEFFSTTYYNSPQVHPCVSMESGSLSEELFFVCQPSHDFFICSSLMRQAGKENYNAEEFSRLQKIAPIFNALVAQHWKELHSNYRAAIELEKDPIETAFATFEHKHLSAREQHIVSLILRGHSSLSIGNQLGIVEGTVKNHRKNIYSKLVISSQAELFAKFVRHALAK